MVRSAVYSHKVDDHCQHNAKPRTAGDFSYRTAKLRRYRVDLPRAEIKKPPTLR